MRLVLLSGIIANDLVPGVRTITFFSDLVTYHRPSTFTVTDLVLFHALFLHRSIALVRSYSSAAASY